MRDPVEIVYVGNRSLYAGRSLRAALVQLEADLGSATLAVEEARESGELSEAEAKKLEVQRQRIVKAAAAVDKLLIARGWEPDALEEEDRSA